MEAHDIAKYSQWMYQSYHSGVLWKAFTHAIFPLNWWHSHKLPCARVIFPCNMRFSRIICFWSIFLTLHARFWRNSKSTVCVRFFILLVHCIFIIYIIYELFFYTSMMIVSSHICDVLVTKGWVGTSELTSEDLFMTKKLITFSERKSTWLWKYEPPLITEPSFCVLFTGFIFGCTSYFTIQLSGKNRWCPHSPD